MEVADQKPILPESEEELFIFKSPEAEFNGTGLER